MKKASVKLTSIRLNIRLADEAAKILGAKSRSEAVNLALQEIVGLKQFKALMTAGGGKFIFDAHDR